jgi:hypothetical protein
LNGENKGIVKRRGPREKKRVTKSVRGLSWTTNKRLRRKAKIKEDLEGGNESADVMKASVGGDL